VWGVDLDISTSPECGIRTKDGDLMWNRVGMREDDRDWDIPD
jgi:hypothetical protein